METDIIESDIVQPNIEPDIVQPNTEVVGDELIGDSDESIAVFNDPTPVKMDDDSYSPPKIPETVIENPHSDINISYEFFETTSIKYSENGEVDTSGGLNIFSIEVPGPESDPGIFKINSGEASVSDVTLSIVNIFTKLFDRMKSSVSSIPKKSTNQNDFLKFLEQSKKKLEQVRSQAGRDNVAPAYKDMYNSFIEPLTTKFKDIDPHGIMSPDNIKSFFVGPSAIKAILDSGPLGETVLNAIDYNLIPCFDKLAINEKDIDEYLTISEKTPLGISRTEVIKMIDFWIVLEYCRVFQLVSADIVGAINGLMPLKVIIENTPFTGFINIPRGSGGQIALDNKVCIYSLFLSNIFDKPHPSNLNFFNVDNYSKILGNFYERISISKEFLFSRGINSNIEQITYSIHQVMILLQSTSTGVLKGTEAEKSGKIIDIYNTYKFITIFAEFIEEYYVFFKATNEALNNSYDVEKLIVHNSPWITWLCFQLSRHQQTQKVYDNMRFEPSDSVTIIDSLNNRKNQYCKYIKDHRKTFLMAWYKALCKVYIYEAFCGHDNNSYELTLMSRDVFGNKGKYSTFEQAFSEYSEKKKGYIKKDNKRRKRGAEQESDIDVQSGDEIMEEEEKLGKEEELGKAERFELAMFLSEFIKGDGYIGKPELVIERVLKESNCTAFSELINTPENSILWTVGQTGKQMINKREIDNDTKLPMNVPTISFLDIITGEKHGENTINVVVDLAKYTPLPIINIRGIDQIRKILPGEQPNEEGPMEEGPMEEGPMEEGPMEEGPMEEGPMEEGPMEEANSEILLTNKMLEQSVLKNMFVNTVYIPIFSGVDAAAFSKPKSARYSTGTLKLPIDVGNNITMVITLQSGLDDTFYKNLYLRDTSKTMETVFAEYDKSKENFAKCLDFFLKKAENEKGSVLKIAAELKSKLLLASKYKQLYEPQKPTKLKEDKSQYFSFQFISKPEDPTSISNNVNTANFSFLIQQLLNNIKESNNYNDYYLFLQAAIPNIKALHATDELFKNSGLGNLWRQLINSIASNDLLIAKAFIETIIPVNKIYNHAKDKIDICKIDIDKFIDFLARIQPKCPMYPTITDAALQQKMNKEGITFCICKIQDGQIHYKFANKSEYVIEQFPEEVAAIGEEKFLEGVGVTTLSEFGKRKNTINASSVDASSVDASSVDASSVDTSSFDASSVDNSGKIAALNFLIDPLGENVLERKRKRGDNYKQIVDVLNIDIRTWNQRLQEATESNNEFYQNFCLKQIDDLRKLIDLNNRLIELEENQGGGGTKNGGALHDEEKDTLKAEIAQLEKHREEQLIKMVQFTAGPITDGEITTTALLLGPELFETVAESQNLENKVIYDKLFAVNAGNIPFDTNKEVITQPVDTVLPVGTTIEDFNNKLVTVKYVDDKYYIERADTFFNTFLGKDDVPHTVVEEVAKNVVTKVEEVAEMAVEKVEEAIASLTTPTVIEDKPIEDIPIEYKRQILDVSASTNAPIAAAAAAGGFKNTKKQRKRAKKLTKRKKNKSKRNKSKNTTKRKRGEKKPKKTKRRN